MTARHVVPAEVLLVASTLDDDGGIPVCVGHLARGLSRLGIAVAVVGQHAGVLSPACAGPDADAFVVEAIQSPWTVRGQAAAARTIARFVASRAAANRRVGRGVVVHAHGVWVLPVIAAVAAARSAGAGVAVSPHGMLRRDALRKSPWRKQAALALAVRGMIANADTLHATSPDEAEELERQFPGCRPRLLPLGIEPIARAIRSEPRPGAPRVVGCLGRILPIKNLESLLDAWKTVAPEGWRLVVAGPGDPDYVGTLRGRCLSLGIDHLVEFRGSVAREELGDFLTGLDLFVLPSRSEAFSLVVGEALAAGVPVVASTAAPWQGVVDHGCGWWVEPTAAALAAALRVATALPTAALAAMGKRGAEWVRREYDWGVIAARHLTELYEPTLAAALLD
ncbi:MAG: glycosyltransferase [Planctomycetes bacterium]|nr:glycosyltransferase [Planctomycetota bacterium]